uniref:Pentapeptide repeat-containing protein n=1 Tax=Candidatus Kentrum sp. DK TaxID=2126562 RepID=A0A450S8G2_9GAMM|nr:MAG: Pentapeptide repeat-containing protein [Candidatus Kentron sp. DK]
MHRTRQIAKKALWLLYLAVIKLSWLLYFVARKAPWALYNLSGARHIWEMAWPRKTNDPEYRKPPTVFLWAIGLYAALYGIAATHYESALDRVENRMGALASQLATGNDKAFENLIEQLPRIQRMPTPPEPRLWSPPSVVASLLTEEKNPAILDWTRETVETWKSKLAGLDLQGIDLSGAALREAKLSGAELRGADLSGARLWGANLSGAWLWGANLSGAELRGANLSGAGLEWANLSEAWLEGANLSGARLSRADLSGAVLGGADLSGAELRDIRNWRQIKNIKDANLLGIREAPEGFRAWAREQGAVELEPAAWQAYIKEKYPGRK